MYWLLQFENNAVQLKFLIGLALGLEWTRPPDWLKQIRQLRQCCLICLSQSGGLVHSNVPPEISLDISLLRFWGQYETAWICNDLFWNRILFCKYPGPLRSHRKGFVFKIYIWISVFRRKKRFENPMLGCREICKINTSPFFLRHPVEKKIRTKNIWGWFGIVLNFCKYAGILKS